MIEAVRKTGAVGLGLGAVALGIAFLTAPMTDPMAAQGPSELLMLVGIGMSLVGFGVWVAAGELADDQDGTEDAPAVEAESEAASRSETA